MGKTPQLYEIAERITLVKNSLLSAHYQNRWSDVGLQQIINRILLLFLERRVAVILEKISAMEEGETRTVGYKILHHSCLDPFWQKDFQDYIENTLYKNLISQNKNADGRLVIDRKKLDDPKINAKNIEIEDCLIPFCGDKYFMFHKVESTKDKNPSLEIDTRKFPPVSKSNDPILSALAEELESALKNQNIADYFINNEKINNNNIFRKYTERQEAKIYKELSDRLAQDWPEEGTDFFEGERFEKIKEIFDREYRKIRKSALLVGKEVDSVPNIFFSIRTFSQQACRFDDGKHNGRKLYPYGVRLIIPNTQREDLKKGFEKFHNEYGASGKRPRLKDASGAYIDDTFWKKLGSDRGIDEILDTLASPYGLYARGMSDAVFCSGYINIKDDPFSFGATNRLEKSELEKGYESSDYCISVYFHYMLLMIFLQKNKLPAGKKQKENLFILLVPGNVGGSPFFCTGFVFKREGQEDHQGWLDSYHFYHSIRHYLIRSIRRKIRSLYLDEIQNIYENKQDDFLDNLVNEDTFRPDEVCNRLNRAFKELSRVYPFQYIKFKYVPKAEQLSYQKKHAPLFFLKYVGSNVSFAVHANDNPFFVSHINSEQFLGAERIKECLLEADSNLKTKLAVKIEIDDEKHRKVIQLVKNK
ncbi:MAG: hypothetical protein NMNS01_11950 [Nitrosomonas sp.]|nr:MAG: hypothetical protein NMNS01_11950 [Nitrosomonas sp.]